MHALPQHLPPRTTHSLQMTHGAMLALLALSVTDDTAATVDPSCMASDNTGLSGTITKFAASLFDQMPRTQDTVDHVKTIAMDGLEHVKTVAMDGLEHVENTTKGPVDHVVNSLPDEIKLPFESWPTRVKYFYVPVVLPLLLLTLCTMVRFVLKHKRRGRTTKQTLTSFRLAVHMTCHMMKSVGKDAAKTKSPFAAARAAWQWRDRYQASLTDTSDKTIQDLKKMVLDDRFSEADKDGSRALDQGEAMDLVIKVADEEFGVTAKPNKEKFDKIFKHFDTNGDGMIDRDEFEPFWALLFKKLIEKDDEESEGQDQTEAQAKRKALLKERGY